MKKRTWLTILALVCVISAVAVPLLVLTPRAEASTGFDPSAGTIGSDGWADFKAYIETTGSNNGKGKTFSLTGDITLNWGVDALKYFSGTLDGQKYTITLNGYTSGDIAQATGDSEASRAVGGIVHSLEDGGQLKEIRVNLAGAVSLNDNIFINGHRDGKQDASTLNIGVLVGAIKSNSQVSNVQVYSKNKSTLTVEASKSEKTVICGGIAGYIRDSGIEGAISSVGVNAITSENIVFADNGYVEKFLTTNSSAGGIVGEMGGNSKIVACYANGEVRARFNGNMTYVGMNVGIGIRQELNYTFNNKVYVGGIVGNALGEAANIIGNCCADNPEVNATFNAGTGVTGFQGASWGLQENLSDNSKVFASVIGNNVRQPFNANYVTSAAMSGATYSATRGAATLGSKTENGSMLYAVNSNGGKVTSDAAAQYVLANSNLVYPIINNGLKNPAWGLDNSGMLTLLWAEAAKPEIRITPNAGTGKDDVIVKIKRRVNETKEKLFYYIQYWAEGRFASPIGVVKKGATLGVSDMELYLYEVTVDQNNVSTYVKVQEEKLNPKKPVNVKNGATYQIMAKLNGTNLDQLKDVKINWEAKLSKGDSKSKFSSTESGKITIEDASGVNIYVTATYENSTTKAEAVIVARENVGDILIDTVNLPKCFVAGTAFDFNVIVGGSGVKPTQIKWMLEGAGSSTIDATTGAIKIGATEMGRNAAEAVCSKNPQHGQHEAGTVTVVAYYDMNSDNKLDAGEKSGFMDIKIYKTPESVAITHDMQEEPNIGVIVKVGDTAPFKGKTMRAAIKYKTDSGYYTPEDTDFGYIWNLVYPGGTLADGTEKDPAKNVSALDNVPSGLDKLVAEAGKMSYTVTAIFQGKKIVSQPAVIYILPVISITPGDNVTDYVPGDVKGTITKPVSTITIPSPPPTPPTPPTPIVTPTSTKYEFTAELSGKGRADSWKWEVWGIKNSIKIQLNNTDIDQVIKGNKLTITLRSDSALTGDITIKAFPVELVPIEIRSAFSSYYGLVGNEPQFTATIKQGTQPGTGKMNPPPPTMPSQAQQATMVYAGDNFSRTASLATGSSGWDWKITNPNGAAQGSLKIFNVVPLSSSTIAQQSTCAISVAAGDLLPGEYTITATPAAYPTQAQTFKVFVMPKPTAVQGGSPLVGDTLTVTDNADTSFVLTPTMNTISPVTWAWSTTAPGLMLENATTATPTIKVAGNIVTSGSYTVTGIYTYAGKSLNVNYIFQINKVASTGLPPVGGMSFSVSAKAAIESMALAPANHSISAKKFGELPVPLALAAFVPPAAPPAEHPWWYVDKTGAENAYMLKIALPDSLNGYDAKKEGSVNEPGFAYYVIGTKAELTENVGGKDTPKSITALKELIAADKTPKYKIYDPGSDIKWIAVTGADEPHYIAVWVDASETALSEGTSALSASNVVVFDLAPLDGTTPNPGAAPVEIAVEPAGSNKNPAQESARITTQVCWSIDVGQSGTGEDGNTKVQTPWATWSLDNTELTVSLKEMINGENKVYSKPAAGYPIDAFAWVTQKSENGGNVAHGTASTDQRLSKPIILPSENGKVNIGEGVTISYPGAGSGDGSSAAEIWYSVSYSDVVVEPLDLKGNPVTPPAGTTIQKYTRPIPFPEANDIMTIVAMAKITDGTKPVSYSSYVTYTDSNRELSKNVEVKIDSVPFDASALYDYKKAKLTLYHQSLENKGPKGKVYYALDGADPDPNRGGIEYKSGAVIAFPATHDRTIPLHVKAIFVPEINKYQKSEITDVSLAFMIPYKQPKVHLASYVDGKLVVGRELKNGETVPKKQVVVFAPQESDFLKEMLPSFGDGIATGVDPATGELVLDPEATAQGEKRVIFDKGETYAAPHVFYAKGAVTNISQITSGYVSEAPKIINRKVDSAGVWTANVTQAIAPYPIVIDGAAGETLQYSLYVNGADRTRTDSDILTFSIKIRNDAAKPVAICSDTSDKQPKTVKVGSIIQLTSEAGTEVYYTTENETLDEAGYQMRIDWEVEFGKWLKANAKLPATAPAAKYIVDSAQSREYYVRLGHPEPMVTKYLEPIKVEHNPQSYIYLNALAISRLDTDNDTNTIGLVGPSLVGRYEFIIAQLDDVKPVTATPETDLNKPAERKRGEYITLKTESTNTTIYYTLDASLPVPTDRINYSNALENLKNFGKKMLLPKEKVVLDGYFDKDDLAKLSDDALLKKYLTGPDANKYGPATLEYSYTDKIKMEPKQGETAISVLATAIENDGMMNNSKVERFDYQLQKVAPVTAVTTPIAEAGEVKTLEPGTTIILSTTTSGANIYYTLDNTIPDPDARDAYNANPAGTEPTTMIYDPEKGLSMPENVKTFYVISAVAAVPAINGQRDYATSEFSRFMYQSPQAVQAVYSSPVPGSVVKGTKVTLKTTTEGATIYYEVATSGKAKDPVMFKSQTFEEGGEIVIDANSVIRAMAAKNKVKSAITEYKYVVAEQLALPTASIATGSVVGKGTNLKLTSNAGATIVYTLDGSDPTDPANKAVLYGETVLLDADYGKAVSIKAYAKMTGFTPSEMLSVTYTIATAESYLTVNPASGTTIANNSVVTFATTVSGGTIRYTVDGTDPTAASATGTSVTLTGAPGANVILKVSVFDSAGNLGTTKLFTYKIQEQAIAPSANQPSGMFFMSGASVTLTAPEGAIYYTTDGSDPTTSSSLYANPIVLNESVIIKAFAAIAGKSNSNIVQFVYTKAGQTSAPEFNRTSGEIDQGTPIALISATEGASIYYTTQGIDPTADNIKELTLYTGPIPITRPVTIKAIAIKDQLHASLVNSATYTVKVPEKTVVDDEESALPPGTSTDRLASRREYSNASSGVSLKGVLVSNKEYGLIVAALDGAIPKDCELVITELTPSSADRSSVSSVVDYGIQKLYEVKLMRNGEEVKPEGEVEFGIPIEAKYQNATVEVVQLSDNGSAEVLSTRRSGGMAYVLSKGLYRIAITTPELKGENDNTLLWIALGVTGAAVIGGGIAIFIILKKRKKTDGGASKPLSQQKA